MQPGRPPYMSIILDALKKAQKDRSVGKLDESKSLTGKSELTSIVFDQKGGGKKKVGLPNLSRRMAVLIFVAGVLVLGLAFKSKIVARLDLEKNKATSVSAIKVFDNRLDEKEVSDMKAQALEAFEKGDFETSKKKWAKLVNADPQNPEYLNNLGLVYKKIGKKAEAKDAYTQALGIKPEYPEALNNMGALVLEGGDPDGAAVWFEKAISASPDYADAYFHLALTYEKLDKKSDAVKNFRNFLQYYNGHDSQLKRQVEMRIVYLASFKSESDSPEDKKTD